MLPVFEPHRAILMDVPDPRPFHVTDYLPLAEALAQHKLQSQEQVLVGRVAETALVLPMLNIVYHHVAQGKLGEVAWMAAFCSLCNSGAVFNARHANTLYTFGAQGYYDVMVLIADQQTQSYWNHLTGLCLYGPRAGTTLERFGPLVHMSAGQALEAYPEALTALSESMTEEEMAEAEHWNAVYRTPAQPSFDEELLATGVAPDARLPRYDMGLGLWTPHTQRYYPMAQLYKHQNVIVDRVDGRSVVILLNEVVGLPFAFYCKAEGAVRQGSRILFSPNTFYQRNALYVNGRKVQAERPNQAAIRWYGFSSMFPGCEIYSV